MVSDLISLGANVNEQDGLGKTPLHLCAENGYLRVLEVNWSFMLCNRKCKTEQRNQTHLILFRIHKNFTYVKISLGLMWLKQDSFNGGILAVPKSEFIISKSS